MTDREGCVAPQRWQGTANGYRNKGCRCLECREAWRLYMKRLRYDHERGQRRRMPTVMFTRRVRALMCMGWRQDDIAAAMGLTGGTQLRQTMRSPTVTKHRLDKLKRVYVELADKPGPSELTALKARRAGFLPPAAYDDGQLDDPLFVPVVEPVPAAEWMDWVVVDEAVRGRHTRPLTVPERREVVRRLHALGLNDSEIGERAGLHERKVWDYRKALGLPANNDPQRWSAERRGLGRGA